MAPTRPKLAGDAARKAHYVSWDELVAEATVDLSDYELSFGVNEDGERDSIAIPCPDGDQYIDITQGQRLGDAGLILRALVRDEDDFQRLRIKMRGVHFPIIDNLASSVLRYYFGLTPDDQGNPDAS